MHSFLPKLGRAALVLGACWAITGQARAALSFQAVGDPIEAQSWLQAFQLVGDTSFSHVGLVMTPYDVTAGFKDSAWDFSLGNPHNFTGGAVYSGLYGTQWSVAGGDATTDFVWQSHFDGDESSQSFLLTLYAFDDSLSWDVGTAFWDGSGWDFGPHTPGITWDEFVASGGVADIVHVPVPPAALLGVFGLGLVGVVRRRLA